MRRILVLLASAGVALAGLVVTTPPAAAATGTLTVMALGRDGKPVEAAVQLGNRKKFRQYQVTSGRPTRVPQGSYLLLVDVFNDRDGTDTLAARHVTVGAGSTRVTIDARRGRRVRVALSPAAPNGYRQHFLMAACQTDGLAELEGYTYGNTLYVVPSKANDVDLAYASLWQPVTGSGGPVIVAGTHDGGMPDGVHRTVRLADLATIAVTARRGIETGTASVSLRPDGDDNCLRLISPVGATRALPFSFAARVSTGRWSVDGMAQDYFGTVVRAARGGHHYRVTLGRAPAGPAGLLPYTNASQRSLHLESMQLFAGGNPGGAIADVTYDLRHRGHVLLHHSGLSDGPDVAARLPAAGWYAVTLSGTRHPKSGQYAPDVLCPRARLRLHVYADPSVSRSVRAFVPRFFPAGLDAGNRAAAGDTTPVGLRLVGPRRGDAVRSVHVWASADGGHSWHRVTVHHAGGRWWAGIRNPAAGFVSLRSTVLDTRGNSATVTIYRAYGVR